MADLSKIKLNGVTYNIKDEIARMMGYPPLATPSSDGLMSAEDKQALDNLNPNIAITLSNVNSSELEIINAKEENLIDILINQEPQISSQIRTNNLLNVNNYTPGYYIGANGTVSTNTNDNLGEFIPVSPGDDIYYTGIVGPTNSSSINRRLHVYNSNQTWIKQLSFAGSLHIGDSWSTHGVIPSNGAYIRVSWGSNDTNVMLSVGAPTQYNPYYITPYGEIRTASFQLASNSSMADAVTYTTNVPNTVVDSYGFKYNPILGKIYLTTGYIASYNGEALSGQWWSDRDTYIEGNSPSIGAQVIYLLDEEDIEEYDCTPLIIEMFYQQNYFLINGGTIINISYYAESLAARHITIYDGATFGGTNIVESDIIGWNNAASKIDLKADIDSPIFTGAPQAPTPNIGTNSNRLATTAFVQTKMNNIAKLETSSKASKNYSIGDYLIMGGQMFKVTAPITQNSTITAGTNVEATDVATELLLLFSLINNGG